MLNFFFNIFKEFLILIKFFNILHFIFLVILINIFLYYILKNSITRRYFLNIIYRLIFILIFSFFIYIISNQSICVTEANKGLYNILAMDKEKLKSIAIIAGVTGVVLASGTIIYLSVKTIKSHTINSVEKYEIIQLTNKINEQICYMTSGTSKLETMCYYLNKKYMTELDAYNLQRPYSWILQLKKTLLKIQETESYTLKQMVFLGEGISSIHAQYLHLEELTEDIFLPTINNPKFQDAIFCLTYPKNPATKKLFKDDEIKMLIENILFFDREFWKTYIICSDSMLVYLISDTKHFKEWALCYFADVKYSAYNKFNAYNDHFFTRFVDYSTLSFLSKTLIVLGYPMFSILNIFFHCGNPVPKEVFFDVLRGCIDNDYSFTKETLGITLNDIINKFELKYSKLTHNEFNELNSINLDPIENVLLTNYKKNRSKIPISYDYLTNRYG